MDKEEEKIEISYSLFIDLIERCPLLGLIKACYHFLTKNNEKFHSCLQKQLKLFFNTLKITPGIGHIIGLFCYIMRWKETGDIYIKYSSRTLVCAGTGAICGYFSNISLDDLLKLSSIKHLLLASFCSIGVGCLYDYSNSFQKTIKFLNNNKNPQEKKIIPTNNMNEIKIKFPFGIVKSYKKIQQKPEKKIKYWIRTGFHISLIGFFGLAGFYFCLKVEKSIYSYVYKEIKNYAMMGSIILLLFI